MKVLQHVMTIQMPLEQVQMEMMFCPRYWLLEGNRRPYVDQTFSRLPNFAKFYLFTVFSRCFCTLDAIVQNSLDRIVIYIFEYSGVSLLIYL